MMRVVDVGCYALVALVIAGCCGSSSHGSSGDPTAAVPASAAPPPVAPPPSAAADPSAQKAQEKRFARAMASMKTEVDEVKEITWFKHKGTPQKVNSASDVHLYFGEKKKDLLPLRLEIQHVYSGDWLFIQEYTFKVDDQTYTLKPGFDEVKHENDERLWEWWDTRLETAQVDMIIAIIKSKKTILRHSGEKYYGDRIISPAEKTRLAEVLTAYLAQCQQLGATNDELCAALQKKTW